MTSKQTIPKYVMTGSEILKFEIDETPMLIENLLPKKGIALLAGSSDTGKSYLGLNLSIAICLGLPTFLGLALKQKYKNVIIVSTEDSPEDVSIRMKKLTKQYSDLVPIENLRFIFETEGLPQKLMDELKREPADLIILDTFGDLYTKDINNSIEVRKFLKPYRKLADTFGVLIIICHHIGKGKENNPNPVKSDVLGSQAIESACRTVVMLKKTEEFRTLHRVKGNYLNDECKKEVLKLSFSTSEGFKFVSKSITSNNSKSSAEVAEKEQKLHEEIIQLHKNGLSCVKISESLKSKGIKVSKSKVGIIIKNNCTSNPKP